MTTIFPEHFNLLFAMGPIYMCFMKPKEGYN